MPLPDQMRVAVYHRRGDLRVERRPLPELGSRDVLLRVSHCGVCGTDLHLVLDGWGRPGSIGGHEYSGEIAALGSDVTAWALGDAVVGGPLIWPVPALSDRPEGSVVALIRAHV